MFAALLLLCGAARAESPVKIEGSLGGGFDNNVTLDSARKGDWFTQETVEVSGFRIPVDFAKIRAAANVYNVNYFEATDQNAFIPGFETAAQFALSPRTLVETEYRFDWVDFPNNDDVTFTQNRVRAGGRYKLNAETSVRSGTSVVHRAFTDRKLRSPNGLLSGSDERRDWTFEPDAEISYRFSKDTLARVGFIYGRNDSNDLFHDFYDYEEYETYVSLVHRFTRRLTGYLKGSYQARGYDSRPLLNAASPIQEDDTWTGLAGLFWKFSPHLSLGATYSYRQRDSNEPSQEYSGSITNVGLHFSF